MCMHYIWGEESPPFNTPDVENNHVHRGQKTHSAEEDARTCPAKMKTTRGAFEKHISACIMRLSISLSPCKVRRYASEYNVMKLPGGAHVQS